MTDAIRLSGLFGANPLAFLATLGVLSACDRRHPEIRLRWVISGSGFTPELIGLSTSVDDLLDTLESALHDGPVTAFSIEPRLPFPAATFRAALLEAATGAHPGERHPLDLLAALGTEAHQDDKGNFQDTALRMVRSGDAAGQGLPAYATTIRRNTDRAALQRTLFQPWDYRDDGSSLRWDPLEDQRYALRWYDPSPESNKKFAVRSMRGANALALEGLALLPVQPKARKAATTGFHTLDRRREVLTWPIWDAAVPLDVVRSLVALQELHDAVPDRRALHARGIVEVYRCERIAPNQYYKNFSPAMTP